MPGPHEPRELTASLLSHWAQEPGFAVLREGPLWRVYRAPQEVVEASDRAALLPALERIEQHLHSGGEAAGFLPYEAGYALEPRLHPLLAKSRGPLAWFGLYAGARVADRLPFPDDDAGELAQGARMEIERDRYCAKIEAIRELIAQGEVYQINFTDRVRFRPACGAWKLFAALLGRHPVPYAAFLNTGSEQIVSLSPELFFRRDGGRITVKPMKGTAPRGRTLEEDRQRGRELETSEKNRAENVMIVDLMRNDLGRICRSGSVKTTRLFEVERFGSVWQMTSTIEGALLEGCGVPAIVRALFPSGSVTGAPKIRAMEHIAALEESERGVYTGAIGYFAPRAAQFNVAIRTATLDADQGVIGVGGGITYDSSGPAEWEECQWKAAFLTRSTPDFRILETLSWEPGYTLLDAHLARLRDSAEYFGFPFDGPQARAALEELAKELGTEPRRVRMTLARDGALRIEHSELRRERFGRVRISARRVSSADPFLYHKTTHRHVFDQEWAAAREARCDDALFFNERGELTEGAIHNVFLVKDGLWRTPPVECGLLPGTLRAQILRERPDTREEVLILNDLLGADKIYLCNSVRGLYPVELVREESPNQQHSVEIARKG